MLTRDTPVEQPILIMWVCATFIIVISTDAVSLVAAIYGTYGACNARKSIPMSKTPVLMVWRRCDLELPRQRPQAKPVGRRRFIPEARSVRVQESRTQQLSAKPESYRDLDLRFHIFQLVLRRLQ